MVRRAGGHIFTRRLTGAGALLKWPAPDLLLDLQMPVLDLLGVIRHLCTGASPPRFPVFVPASHIAGPQAAGADVFLTTPMQIKPLAAAFCARRSDDDRHTVAIGADAAPDAGDLVDTENLSSVFGMLEPAASATLLFKF